MTVFLEQVDVVVERQDEGRFGPEGNIDEVVLVGDDGSPGEESVGDHTSEGGILIGTDQIPDKLIHVGREDMENALLELVVIKRAVKPQGEAVGEGGVADVQTGFLGDGYDVVFVVVGLGLGDLGMDVMGVDEGYGEAS